ncbi:hypothetical protein JCM19992_01630 [Thermostilla marina]
MRRDLRSIGLAGGLVAAVTLVGVVAAAESAAQVDIFAAATAGDLAAIRAYLASGGDLDVKQPESGITPLMTAALHGHTEAVTLLLERGADPNLPSGDGSTPLHAAAFFCRADIVTLLLDHGADINRRNARSETPLDTVAGPWSDRLAGVYKTLSTALGVNIDFDAVRKARPAVAALLRRRGAKPGRIPIRPVGYRGAYFLNGEIYVNEFGTPEEKPITTGHWDFKPSWSKDDRLVFFRRLKNDPKVTNWVTQIHIVKIDGSGLHPISDGKHTDFNPTWTRDGTNTPIWNRRHPDRVSFYVMTNDADGKPGEERPLTDMRYHTWAYSCLKDGRILVQSAHPTLGWGYYLMTPNPNGEPTFERIACDLATRGILDRVSISPDETKVCFEYQKGFKHDMIGRTLYVADFNPVERTITNAEPFANAEGARRWFAYPRWTPDGKAIVYHASPSLYMYFLEDGSTVQVSTGQGDYRYPHCERTPK